MDYLPPSPQESQCTCCDSVLLDRRKGKAYRVKALVKAGVKPTREPIISHSAALWLGSIVFKLH